MTGQASTHDADRNLISQERDNAMASTSSRGDRSLGAHQEAGNATSGYATGSRRWDYEITSLLGETGHRLALMVGILTILSLLLAIIAYGHATHGMVIEETTYQHRGTFSYEAASAGDVYPGGIVTTGEPIYRALSNTVNVRYDYELRSQAPIDASGRYRFDAVLSTVDGWRHPIELAPETSFEGNTATMSADIDLSEIDAIIAAHQQQSGTSAADYPHYILSIQSPIAVEGVLGSTELRDEFSPFLNFQLDDRILSVDRAEDSSLSDSLAPTVAGAISERLIVPNNLSIFGVDVDVETSRLVALIGLSLSIVLAMALALGMRAALKADEPARIRGRYGSRIVMPQSLRLKSDRKRIRLRAFQELVEIADLERQKVLYVPQGARHYYLVDGANAIYGYLASAPAKAEASVAPSPSRHEHRSGLLEQLQTWIPSTIVRRLTRSFSLAGSKKSLGISSSGDAPE